MPKADFTKNEQQVADICQNLSCACDCSCGPWGRVEISSCYTCLLRPQHPFRASPSIPVGNPFSWLLLTAASACGSWAPSLSCTGTNMMAQSMGWPSQTQMTFISSQENRCELHRDSSHRYWEGALQLYLHKCGNLHDELPMLCSMMSACVKRFSLSMILKSTCNFIKRD